MTDQNPEGFSDLTTKLSVLRDYLQHVSMQNDYLDNIKYLFGFIRKYVKVDKICFLQHDYLQKKSTLIFEFDGDRILLINKKFPLKFMDMTSEGLKEAKIRNYFYNN